MTVSGGISDVVGAFTWPGAGELGTAPREIGALHVDVPLTAIVLADETTRDRRDHMTAPGGITISGGTVEPAMVAESGTPPEGADALCIGPPPKTIVLADYAARMAEDGITNVVGGNVMRPTAEWIGPAAELGVLRTRSSRRPILLSDCAVLAMDGAT